MEVIAGIVFFVARGGVAGEGGGLIGGSLVFLFVLGLATARMSAVSKSLCHERQSGLEN